MEYVYAAMLLHSAKKEITEKALTEVLKSAGVEVDATRAKALIASLKEVNIDDAIAKASVAAVAVPAAHAEAKEEEKPEDKGKTEEEAAAGLGSLFG